MYGKNKRNFTLLLNAKATTPKANKRQGDRERQRLHARNLVDFFFRGAFFTPLNLLALEGGEKNSKKQGKIILRKRSFYASYA